MTEPSPSPIPTTSSSQSWLDSLGPLDDLWANHPFVAFVLGVLITAVLAKIGWARIQVWRKWRNKQHKQRITRRRQQLPPALPPFTVESRGRRLILEPAQPQHESVPEGMSIVRLLSAKSTPVPFLDRAEALTRLETWARSKEPLAIHVLGGDGGSGKTRLGVELCRCLTDPNTPRRGAEVWKAGFLQNIEQSDNASSSDDASSLLLVIDYAEGRPDTVKEVINIALRAAEEPERRRVRIVFLVRRPSPLPVTHRSSNEWLDALRPQESENEGLNRLLDEASTIILNDEKLSDIERRELFTQAYRSFTNSPNSLPSADLTGRLSDPMYSQPLLVTADALLNARPLPNSRNGCSPGELFEEVLRHEERYWAEHWPSNLAVNTDRDHQRKAAATPTDAQDEKRESLNRELARQAVAAATLTDIQDEEDAISLLQLLPTNPGENIKDLAEWLRDCYPPHVSSNRHSTLWCEHLEPDRIGERLVASEANNLASLLRELLSPSRVGTSSLRTWTVLERASTDPHLNECVGRILNDVLVEVTQAVHAQVVDSQSPDLATGFAKLFSAVCSHIDSNKAHEAEQTLSEGGYFTASLECELAQCAANIGRPTDDAPEADRATYASRRSSLSRCLANTGRHDEALKAAREATNLFRVLDGQNPAAYTPRLAGSLNNLASSQAENGQLHEALKTAQEATDLYRTLAEHNPAAYTPDLARSLNNLAIRQADNGRQHEALKTAQEATDLYRTLAEHNPAAYTPHFARSLNNLASYLAGNGQLYEALKTAQEATKLYRTLAEHNPAAYTPELATSLNNLANSQAENGQQHEALKTAQEAVTIRKKLAEQNPAAYNPDLATSLNNLAILLSGGELYKQALNYAQEATTLFRGLAGEQLRAFGSRFVATLRTYAIILDHCGDAAEAARIRQERNETLKRMKEMETGND